MLLEQGVLSPRLVYLLRELLLKKFLPIQILYNYVVNLLSFIFFIGMDGESPVAVWWPAWPFGVGRVAGWLQEVSCLYILFS